MYYSGPLFCKCPPHKDWKIDNLSPKNRIILPLDVSSFEEVEDLIKKLNNHIGLFKVGLTLFLSQGFSVIERIHDLIGGQRIFVDLKLKSGTFNFDDIPRQMEGVNSVMMSGSHGVHFFSVHTSEGEEAVRKVVQSFKNGSKVLGITVLTSLGKEDLPKMGHFTTIEKRVLELSQKAKNAGCDGVVCSGHEAKSVRREFEKNFIIVTPGIRPKWSKIKDDDQRRIVTPGEAIKNGADFIVVGRPISTADDRVGAAQKIADEIQEAQEAIEK